MDATAFRTALSEFVTGVAVVTAREGELLLGVTINSFNSVSLDPPLVLFSLDRRLRSLPALMSVEFLAINLLGRDQEHISRQFAMSTGPEKWAGVDYVEGLGGAPLICGSLLQFQCRPHAQHEGGDHVICVVRVVSFARSEASTEPLVFFRSKYHHLDGIARDRRLIAPMPS